MRPTALTCLLILSMMLTACGSPGSDSGDGLTCGPGTQPEGGQCVAIEDGLSCGPGTQQVGDQCVGIGDEGDRPHATPDLTGDFSDQVYSFVRYSYVMSLLSDGERVAIRIVFDNLTAPIMQIEGPVTGATTFAVDIAGVDVNGDLDFGEGEVFDSTGDGSLVETQNYDGRTVQVLTIENVVIGGEEFGYIDGILDSTYPLTPVE